MIADFTQAQLRDLRVSSDRPLVICDVDEVVVHFTQSFESYLKERNLWLDTRSFALSGNIRALNDDTPVSDESMMQLIDDFFVEQTEHLPAIDGAIAALLEFGKSADVVMLTNLPHHARDKRVRNLKKLGLDYPVITNSGPKGPAIRNLADRTRKPVVFVDDSPMFIHSAREHAPEIHIVHFMHDERYGRHVDHFEFLSLRTDSWGLAAPHIQSIIGSSENLTA